MLETQGEIEKINTTTNIDNNQDLSWVLNDRELRKLVPQTDVQTWLSHDFLNPICAVISVMSCILDWTFEPSYLKEFISDTDFLKYKERYNISNVNLEEWLEDYIEHLDRFNKRIQKFKWPVSKLLEIFSTISIMIEWTNRFSEYIKGYHEYAILHWEIIID